MNAPRNNKSNPTARVGALIVIIVALVIAMLLYNAIKGKREYDRENADTQSASTPAAQAASAVLGASAAAGASQ